MRFYFVNASQSIVPYWWNGTTWIPCSNYRVVYNHTGSYDGYVKITISNTTSPSLADLTGTPFGLGSPPSSASVGGNLVPINGNAYGNTALMVFLVATGFLAVGAVLVYTRPKSS